MSRITVNSTYEQVMAASKAALDVFEAHRWGGVPRFRFTVRCWTGDRSVPDGQRIELHTFEAVLEDDRDLTVHAEQVGANGTDYKLRLKSVWSGSAQRWIFSAIGKPSYLHRQGMLNHSHKKAGPQPYTQRLLVGCEWLGQFHRVVSDDNDQEA